MLDWRQTKKAGQIIPTGKKKEHRFVSPTFQREPKWRLHLSTIHDLIGSSQMLSYFHWCLLVLL